MLYFKVTFFYFSNTNILEMKKGKVLKKNLYLNLISLNRKLNHNCLFPVGANRNDTHLHANKIFYECDIVF